MTSADISTGPRKTWGRLMRRRLVTVVLVFGPAAAVLAAASCYAGGYPGGLP
jgi:hypothetical protein